MGLGAGQAQRPVDPVRGLGVPIAQQPVRAERIRPAIARTSASRPMVRLGAGGSRLAPFAAASERGGGKSVASSSATT